MIKPANIPEYIRKHSARTPNGGLKIAFPQGSLKTEEDAREQLKAKRWLRTHNGYYIDWGRFWILPLGSRIMRWKCLECGRLLGPVVYINTLKKRKRQWCNFCKKLTKQVPSHERKIGS